ncbi:MAG: putative LPS assembly protein LptD [candidate division WOR-3 bacterium]
MGVLLEFLLLSQVSGGPDSTGPGHSVSTRQIQDSVSQDTTSIAPPSEVVSYGGRRVVYDAPLNLVYLLDSAWVRYQDLFLQSDSIVYDIKRATLTSYRGSRFQSAADTVFGEELRYNVDTRKGFITRTATQLQSGFLTAQDLWLVRDKTLDVNSGTYTTCDLSQPHYRFWGRHIRVYLDDMVVVEPLVLYVGRVPVAAAPFWFFPISKKRKSGLLPFRVGNSATEGFYAKDISSYWAINDYADATFVVDAMSRRGFRWSAEGVYIVGPYASGQLLGSFMNQLNDDGSTTVRYSLGARHNSRFLFGTRIEARGDFQSDASFASDYSETPTQWLRNELESFVSISRQFKNLGTGTIQSRRHVDLALGRRELMLPSAAFSLVPVSLGSGWNLSSSFSAGNTESRYLSSVLDSSGSPTETLRLRRTSLGFSPSLALSFPASLLGGLTLPLSGGYFQEGLETLGMQRIHGTRRATASTGLGFSQNLGGVLNLSEGLAYHQTMHLTDSIYSDAALSLSATARTSLYRIFPIEVLDMHGLLHKASPTLSYSYSPSSRGLGPGFAFRLDTAPLVSQFGVALGNDFQAKAGDSLVKRDLGRVNLSSGVNLVTRRLDPIDARLDLVLIETKTTSFGLAGRTSFDLIQHTLSGYTVSSDMRHVYVIRDPGTEASREYSLQLAYFLSKMGSRLDHMLQARTRLQPRGWQFVLQGAWNITDRRITDYRLDVVKDLHCWEFVGNLSRFGARWSYDFKVRIKAIPDVAVGKGLFSWALP